MGEWSSGPGPAQPADEDDSDATRNFPVRDPLSRSWPADPGDPAEQPPPNVERPYQPTEVARPYTPTEFAPHQPPASYTPTELAPHQPPAPYTPTEFAPHQPPAPYQQPDAPRHQAPYVPQGQVPTNVLPGQRSANVPPGQLPPTVPPGQMPNFPSGRPPASAPSFPPAVYQPPASGAQYPPPSAPQYQPPLSGASSDVVRYGPGVPAAAPSQSGVTAEQVWRTGRLPEAPRRKARLRKMLGSALTVALLVAAAVVLYLRFHHASFSVSSATITSETKNGCGVNVTGRIDTNGAAGTVSYQWVFQPQLQAPQPLSQSVVSGQHAVYVTVAVEGQGHGSASQKVTLQVLGPNAESDTKFVTLSC